MLAITDPLRAATTPPPALSARGSRSAPPPVAQPARGGRRHQQHGAGHVVQRFQPRGRRSCMLRPSRLARAPAPRGDRDPRGEKHGGRRLGHCAREHGIAGSAAPKPARARCKEFRHIRAALATRRPGEGACVRPALTDAREPDLSGRHPDDTMKPVQETGGCHERLEPLKNRTD